MKLEEANKLTLQEAFDYAVQKIVEQGGQCLNDEGLCAYGNDKGQHCAVGWLLDESNTELMDYEGSAWGIAERYPEYVPQVVKANVEVFNLLQNFHDLRQGYSYDQLSDYVDTSAPQYQQWLDMA